MLERLVIVVPEAEYQDTLKIIDEYAVADWPNRVLLEQGAATARKRGIPDFPARESHRLLNIADSFAADQLIVANEVCCNRRILESRPELLRARWSISLIRRNLKKELEALGLNWRSNASEQVRRWEYRKNDPERWLKQFEMFGYRWVGEGILRQFEVVSPEQIAKAFEVDRHTMMGRPFLMACRKDQEDFASSSHRVGAVLTGLHGKSAVADLQTISQAHDPSITVVLCEDALWTGEELRTDVLEPLLENEETAAFVHNTKIALRYCVLADYGILSVRQFLSSRNLVNIDFDFSGSHRIVNVLPEGIDDLAREKWNLPPAEFQSWLNSKVQPLAFRKPKIWLGRADEARAICTQIGCQLIDRYAQVHKKTWPDEIKRGFALGARQFGGVILFPTSAPKPCLPVFWLAGRVEISGISVDWEPLVFDARHAL